MPMHSNSRRDPLHGRKWIYQPIEDRESHRSINHFLGGQLQEIREAIFDRMKRCVEKGQVTLSDKVQKRIGDGKAYVHEFKDACEGSESPELQEISLMIDVVHTLKEELFQRNFGLVPEALAAFQKFARKLEQDDQWDVGEEALLRGTEKWEPKRGELSTLVYTYTKNGLRKSIEKQKGRMLSLDAESTEGFSMLESVGDERAEQPESCGIAHEAKQKAMELLGRLEGPLRRVVELRFGINSTKPMHWQEVVEQLDREKSLTKNGKLIDVSHAKSLFKMGLHRMKKIVEGKPLLDEASK